MERKEFHLGPNDTVVGMDLGSIEHQVIIKSSAGKRLTRFRITHSIEGLNELLSRARMVRANHGCDGKTVFAFEATGHVWEAVAHFLQERGQRYVLVNPLATFRVREARQMSREKTDITDADQIAELVRSGLVTRTQLDGSKYHELRFAWGEYERLRTERARLKTLLRHQLYGLFPELLKVWSKTDTPGLLSVIRLGLTPQQISELTVTDFIAKVKQNTRGRRVWRHRLIQAHRWAKRSVSPPGFPAGLARECRRIVARMDLLSGQMESLREEIDDMLEGIEEARYLRTIPGLGWVSVTGLIAHIGCVDKYRHGRQLIKLAGTNPSSKDTGQSFGKAHRMTRRGRAGMRHVLYMASVSCLLHNPRIRAHYDRLIQREERPLAKMAAIGACMNKLLIYAFAVMKRRQAFDSEHSWHQSQQKLAA
jgi:transposase